MKKTCLIFVRHAEAAGNAERIFHGWTDSELTEKGHVQAAKAAESLKRVPIDVIYSSTLRRTRQTAQYIADSKGLPVITSEFLREIHGGDWEEKRWVDLPELWPEAYHTWEQQPHLHQMPHGESMKDFQQRLITEVHNIIDKNAGRHICVVTHGTAIRTLLCYFYGYPLEKMLDIPWHDNTSITMVEYEEGKFRVIVEGDASHLGKEWSTVQNQDWWKEYIEHFDSRP